MRPNTLLLLLVIVLLLAAPAVAARTTQVQVIRYAGDGSTVLNQTTVDVAWMEANLPVFGDGTTPYLFQGPLTELAASDPAKWNPAEDSNLGKVNETIRGTYLKDLCDLVGGVQPGGEVRVEAADGFGRSFAYDNVYVPLSRQGPMVLAWWTANESYGFADGMELFFAADNSTNPYGLHVFGNEDMRQCFAEKYWCWYGGSGNWPSAAQFATKWVTTVKIYSAPSSDWILDLNGAISKEITKSYFEQGLSWAGHRASYTDANGVWEGMPLWRLIGYVDDGNEHGDLAFNRTLAGQGYTIRVIAADGYNRTFSSQDVAFSTNYIVANTLNGTALPVQINGKNVWPLKLVGANATGGKSVANITEIRVEGVPDVTPTPQPTPTSDSGVRPWAVRLSGYTNFTVTSDYFYEGMACGGHSGTYSDGVNTWMGMPLWRLIGLVDDQLGHEVYIGAFNDTLAAVGYNITVIAGDGFTRTFSSRDVARSDNYLVAAKLNGTELPPQINGKNVWPLKLVGANATGGKSVGNITEIRLTDLPVAGPTVVVLPGMSEPPTDPDGDGKYEDLNGNGRADFADLVLYFNQMTWIASSEPVAAFDWNGNARIDFADVVWLFNHL